MKLTLTTALALLSLPAFAGETICEKKLWSCYQQCRAAHYLPARCDSACSTSRCGHRRPEAYRAYVERLIEESAAIPKGGKRFVSLTLLKKVRP